MTEVTEINTQQQHHKFVFFTLSAFINSHSLLLLFFPQHVPARLTPSFTALLFCMPLPNSTSFLLSFIFCVSSKSFSSSLAVDATAALIKMCTASDGLVRGCVCLSVCGFYCNQTRVAFRMAGRKRLNLT